MILPLKNNTVLLDVSQLADALIKHKDFCEKFGKDDILTILEKFTDNQNVIIKKVNDNRYLIENLSNTKEFKRIRTGLKYIEICLGILCGYALFEMFLKIFA